MVVRNLGGSGIHLGHGSQDGLIANSSFRDIAGNGINVGDPGLFTEHRIDGEPWWKVKPDQAATGNRIRDNRIRDIGEEFPSAVGIWVGTTRRTSITHNEVHEVPYSGISIGWFWDNRRTPARQNTIANNHLYDLVQMMADGAGIYTLGRQPGSEIKGNVIHDVSPSSGHAYTNGIFLDQGSEGFTLRGNLIFAVPHEPVRFHEAGKNRLIGNRYVPYRGREGDYHSELSFYGETNPNDITTIDNQPVGPAVRNDSRYNELMDRVGPWQ